MSGYDDEQVGEPVDPVDPAQREQEREPEVAGEADLAHGVDSQLREAVAEMRAEADAIAALPTGDEQVAAAERFTEDASQLDRQLGAAAREDDDHRR